MVHHRRSGVLRRTRAVVGVPFLVATFVLLPVVPLVAQSQDPQLALTPAAVESGGTVTVTGGGFPATTTGQILWADGSVLGVFATDPAGAFGVDVVVPANAPGAYTISAVTDDGEVGADAEVTIEAPAEPTVAPEVFPTEPPPTATEPPRPTLTPEPTATLTPEPTLTPPPAPAPYPIAGSGHSANSPDASVVFDGDPATVWLTDPSTPDEAWLALDLGQSQPIGSLRWLLATEGTLSSVALRLSDDGVTWGTLTTLDGAALAPGVWYEQPVDIRARYIRVALANPDDLARLGGIAEIEVWPAPDARPLATLITPEPPVPTATEAPHASVPIGAVGTQPPPPAPTGTVAGTPVPPQESASAATPESATAGSADLAAAAIAAKAFTFAPVADAQVEEQNPNRNFGGDATLTSDRSPRREAYLRFTVSGITGPVEQATLRLYVTNGTPNGPSVATSSHITWSETGITWSNRPAVGGRGHNKGNVPSGAWVEYDVTSFVSGNGSYTFALIPDSDDGLYVNAREAASNVPQLVVAADAAAPTATATSTPAESGAIVGGSLTLPIRAAFYYPWFPGAWDQKGVNPYTVYHPSLGFYNGGDPRVIANHIKAMQYGHIQAGIASWWGPGTREDRRMPALLAGAAGTGFKWAVYYEDEGFGNPSVATIRNDLQYLRDHYASNPNYLRVDGRFVVFVYGGGESCATADRWKQANTVGAYVVLKVFSGYRRCGSQPNSWHQYGPASAADHQGSSSYTISPGFHHYGRPVSLGRDLARWQQNVRDMVASGADWQLVTTFNEWGEGTSVESAKEWQSASGYGKYLDVLHNNGGSAPTVPAGSNPSFSGGRLTITRVTSSVTSTNPAYAHDGNLNSHWFTTGPTPPTSARLTLDLGQVRQLTGVKWTYRLPEMDRMHLVVSVDGRSWTTLSTTTARARGTWEGTATSARARYVRLAFNNYSGRVTLGYVSEVQVWGKALSTATVLAAGDIASWSSDADSLTADIVADQPGTVATLGDNAYNNGTAEQFAECHDPTWGRFKDRNPIAAGDLLWRLLAIQQRSVSSAECHLSSESVPLPPPSIAGRPVSFCSLPHGIDGQLSHADAARRGGRHGAQACHDRRDRGNMTSFMSQSPWDGTTREMNRVEWS